MAPGSVCKLGLVHAGRGVGREGIGDEISKSGLQNKDLGVRS